MKKLLLLIILINFYAGALAQRKAPFWLNPYQRESKYPTDKFLVGLSSELVSKKQSLANIYKKLNQASRNQIIESIHVNIKSETIMNISIVNTEATQLLDQNSVSISKAELVGLKFENYYYRKKKTAFSFSYVSIHDLIEFNLDIIKINTELIDKNVALANTFINDGAKENAIKLLFECQTKIKEINQSAVILMALNQDERIDFNKIGQMKIDVAQGVDNFFNKGTLNVQELASFYAYGLQLQIGNEVSVCEGLIQYDDSEKESKFSTEFKKRVINKLADLELVKMAKNECDFIFKGNFNLANNNIIMVTNFVNTQGKVQATVNNKFSYSSIRFGNLTFLPENFEFITNLPKIQILPKKTIYKIKKVDLFNNPVDIEVKLDKNLQKGMPVQFTILRDEAIEHKTTIFTNKNGIARLVLNTEQINHSGEFIIKMKVNVAALLDIPSNSKFLANVLLEHPIQFKKVKLQVFAPTIYVRSTELSMGNRLQINILEPSIKNALLGLDYKFVNNIKEADYIINIKSSTRNGQRNQFGYFSYLDASISMIRISTNKEVYKNSLTNIKGVGANFNLASAKAYQKAKKTIGKDISYQLEFGK